jgi:hypothetical protein
VPTHRPKAPPLPAAGAWQLTWAGTNATMTLTTDGVYLCQWGGQLYRGSWAWEARTRTLHIHETKDGVTWANWSAQLDDGLVGVAVFGVHRTPVSIRQAIQPRVTTAVAAR